MKVGAILNSDPETKILNLIGFGKFERTEVPPRNITRQRCNLFYANAVESQTDVPVIELEDNKGTVYGCECWWGPEKYINNILEGAIRQGYEIVPVDIEKFYSDLYETLEGDSLVGSN